MGKTRIFGCLLTLSILASCAGTMTSAPSFITADEEGNTLTKIAGDGTRQTLTVPIAPHNVQVSADNKWILATGMAEGHEHTDHAMVGSLLIIPADSFDEHSIHSVSLGEHLAHVVTDKSGKTAYVTDSASNRVAVLDLSSGKVRKWIDVGIFPHGARINPVTGDLYTANVKDGTMSIVDTHANKEIKRIPVGNSPIQVAISKNGKKAYVTLAKDSAVAVVDVVEQHKIKAIAVKDAPAQIYADPLGRYMYVADQGSKEHPGDSISVIDVKSDTVIKTTNTGNMPHGVVAGLDGEFVYVTNMGEDTVAQIATKDFSVVNRYPVGKLPNGITLLEKN